MRLKNEYLIIFGVIAVAVFLTYQTTGTIFVLGGNTTYVPGSTVSWTTMIDPQTGRAITQELGCSSEPDVLTLFAHSSVFMCKDQSGEFTEVPVNEQVWVTDTTCDYFTTEPGATYGLVLYGDVSAVIPASTLPGEDSCRIYVRYKGATLPSTSDWTPDIEVYKSIKVVPASTCGDGTCNNGETATTCPSDCSSSVSCLPIIQKQGTTGCETDPFGILIIGAVLVGAVVIFKGGKIL